MASQTISDGAVVQLIQQKKFDELPVFLTPTQVSEILGITTRTVQKYCAKGQISSIRVGSIFRIPTDKLLSSLGLI